MPHETAHESNARSATSCADATAADAPESAAPPKSPPTSPCSPLQSTSPASASSAYARAPTKPGSPQQSELARHADRHHQPTNRPPELTHNQSAITTTPHDQQHRARSNTPTPQQSRPAELSGHTQPIRHQPPRRCPSPTSSPWIRRCPQDGFSWARRTTMSRILSLIGGRPGGLG
jgi:hypothetical protein